MYAVIQTGGKQYRVTEGEILKIEQLAADAGEKIEFDQVLMITDGDNVKLGAPFIKGGKVSAEVLSQGRGKKVRIVKLRRRKNSRRQMGHRQNYTEVKIGAIKV